MSDPVPPGDQSLQLGRYQLVRKLAAGGMAEVFLAKAMGPGGFEKSLVIKRILPHLAKDPEFVQMFLHEAKLAAQFAHPAVVQIFDFGEVNGSYFLAMEYVDGPNLRTILRRLPDRKLSPVLSARIIAEACEGLAYVHEFAGPDGKPLGLMHMDVSTDNLMIARNGAVKVVDFGVSKGAGQQSNAAPGTVKGKIAYMPPEQIIGEADLRSDVYALGVMLYEMAAGTKPYENLPDPKLLEAIILTDPVPLMQRAFDTPPEYAMIVGKAMAKNLNARFQSCRELAAALDDFIANSGERIGARQIGALANLEDLAGATQAAGTGTGSRPITKTPAQVTPHSKVTPHAKLPPASGWAAGASVVLNTRPETPSIAPVVPAMVPGLKPPAPVVPPVAPSQAQQASPGIDPFAAFGSTLGDKPAPVAAPSAPAARPVDDDLALNAATYDEFFDEKPAAALGASPVNITGSFPAFVPGGRPQAMPAPANATTTGAFPAFVPGGRPQPAAPSTSGAFPTFSPGTPMPQPAPSTSGAFPTFTPSPQPSAPKPAPAPAAPAPKDENELRAQALMADASAMRLFDAGAPLAPQTELEPLRVEFERDEGFNLLVRFPRHAARMLKSLPHASGLLAERTAGAVEALLMAEAYGSLATLFERLQAGAGIDEHQKWVFEVATAALATPDQAHRLAMRLREGPPADVEGLGRLLPFFGKNLAAQWLSLSEVIEIAGSRDALLPGLAGLANQNPAPFIERLAEKRPKRLVELVYCLERGKVRERIPLFKEMLGRFDATRKREFFTGLARAATDEGQRLVLQGLTDADDETRLHSIQLIGKYYPERAWKLFEPLLDPNAAEQRSDGDRRAMWKAIGVANQPDGLAAVRDVLAQKGSLLNRGKIESRKLDALEALAAMQNPGALELLKQASEDKAHSEDVRNLAQRYARTFDLNPVAGSAVESRRWERTPSTWRDVAIDLHALALASRVTELSGSAFDFAFTRLTARLDALLAREGRGVFSVQAKVLHVNEAPVPSDTAVEQVGAALTSRGIATFGFSRRVPRQELEHLARWLAAGPGAEGINTPSIERTLTTPVPPRPALPTLPVPSFTDASREAMIRYVNLVTSFRKWLVDRRTNPKAPLPDTRPLFHELACAYATRGVRFLGLLPKAFGRDAELFHAANVTCLALAFGAELGLPRQRLADLARAAFFSDIGNLEMRDEVFTRSGPATEDDQRDVANARKLSAQFPFVRLQDQAAALSWAVAVAEQEIDWGSKDRPGQLGERSNVGLGGSLIAMARAWETLTTSTPRREGMAPEAALDVLTTRVAHRFRPDLLPFFGRFARRVTLKHLRR